MSAQTSFAIDVAAAFTCVAVPWFFMRALRVELVKSGSQVNYRGRVVHRGLGIAWLVWGGAAILAAVGTSGMNTDSLIPVLLIAGPLAVFVFALGLLDDTFGSGDARGFRGHLRALAAGRMTTGMIKLIGISACALFVGFVISMFAPWGSALSGVMSPVASQFATGLIAGVAIALTANTLNLLDLRPGRALKVGSLLLALGCAGIALGFLPLAAELGVPVGRIPSAWGCVWLFVALMGPILAVWRDDVRELGMLGDAGANALGAVAGLVMVIGMPVWVLAVYTVALLMLNLLSERVSFSAVIERTAFLRWLDELGRRDVHIAQDS